MQYIIRLDDACPTMDRSKWEQVFDILDEYNVRAIIAVIPNNEDPSMLIDEHDSNFWNRMRQLQDAGHHIALHGHNHVYTTSKFGIFPMNKRSEFAGVPLHIQKEKIQKGWEIFKRENIISKIWVAPSHTFDKNTLLALLTETTIRTISDGASIRPYSQNEFLWLPLELMNIKLKYHGVWTKYFHPNMMTGADFRRLGHFFKKNTGNFISDIDQFIERCPKRRAGLMELLFFKAFFLKRYFTHSVPYQTLRKFFVKGF